MKRAITPVFWLLFGMGGMLSALFGPALVLITGLAAPTGVGLSPAFMAYGRASTFAHHPIGKLVLLGIIALFVWHGAERTMAWLCYGFAGAATALTAGVLIAIGF